MRRVCHRAASTWKVSLGDIIFNCGEVPSPPQMYVVVSGALRYTLIDGHGATVLEGQWVSEATLWTRWVHCGMLTAACDCRLYSINADEFQGISVQFQHSGFQPSDYAADFVKALDQCEVPSDLPIGMEEKIRNSDRSPHGTESHKQPLRRT